MNYIRPVQRITLGEQVALQLAETIDTGHWKPGQKLPSEAELCQAMGVGRSTIREALKSLAFAGMVRMRAGGGTYVLDGPNQLLKGVLRDGELHSGRDLRDICESRLILETALAALCAERASRAELKKLDKIVERMRSHLNDAGKRFMELDLDFHMAVAGACRNRILTKVLNEIRRALHAWMEKSPESPGSRERALAHHQRILEALQQRDSAKAERAMRRHLGDIRLVDLLLRGVRQDGAKNAAK